MPGSNTVANIASEIIDRAAFQPANRRYLVGIAGGPAAGKTTVANLIVKEINHNLGRNESIAVPMDGFHKTTCRLKAEGLLELKGAPSTFDADSFKTFLQRVKQFENPLWGPDYSREIHDVIDRAYEIKSERIAIVEGNYLYLDSDIWRDIRGLLDFKLFLDVSEDVAIQRLRVRHLGGGKSADDTERHIQRVDVPNFLIVEATRQYADKILTSFVTV